MSTRQIDVQRVSITSSKPFDAVVSALESKVGHPDMPEFGRKIAAAQGTAEIEQIVQAAAGPTGLMEFARYDLGQFITKSNGGAPRHVVRLVVGNPLIMQRMVTPVPDAGSYAPVTILIDQRPDGVHLSYDRMASYLAPYGSEEVLKVARELDAKVEALMADAAK